jgi:3'-phosphoadenosine 5'-phosphosulfate sulfotransferase (PAPS reductase)/FAD synthetase
VMFSGGIGSWAAAKRVAAANGTERLVLLFTDTKTEDEDTYRFLHDAAANVGGELAIIADGRNIWQVFKDEKFLGNTRVDMCSRILKRELADRWLAEHYTPETARMYVGVDWSESHRYERLAARKLPWRYFAPLCDAPYLTKADLHAWAEREGLVKQRLYRMGAEHANCGGGCVKMGQGGFARLYKAWPERFAEWEAHEAELREQLGDVSILRDRRVDAARTTLPLSELRARVDAGRQVDLFAVGGCGCFLDEPEPEAA